MSAPLNPLVPAVVRRLLSDGALLHGPKELGVVALFSDVTGYSRICADLVAHDPRGAEAVGRLMNGLTGAMADAVHLHGGSVLALVGDALIAVWTPEEKDKASAACLAAQCAEALHAIAAVQPMPGGTLRLRIALDTGLVRFADLALTGGRQVVHAGGAMMDNLGQLFLTLGPGETGATDAVAGLLGLPQKGGLHRVTQSFGGALPRLPPVPEPPLDRHVAPTTATLVTASGRTWLAEFRLAQILILHLRETGTRDLPPAFAALSTPIAATGGEVLSAVTDDKGLVVVAVWGLAMSAHEDDADRAVHAALAIAAALPDLGLQFGLGLARGKVFAGLVGGAAEQAYTIVGDAVNLASALATRSKGEVLADAATATAASGRFHMTSAAPIQTKGDRTARAVFCDPVEIDAGTAEPSAPGLIGRARELAFLTGIMAAPRAPTDRAPVLVASGEAGIGKSRLASELQQVARDRGLFWTATATDSLRRAVAHHAWRPVMVALLGPSPGARLADLAARHPGLADHLPLLNPILPAPLPDTPATAAMEPETRASLAREAMADALAALLPDPPGFLCIEDAHWLDSASWQLLADLRRRRADLGWVLLTRPLEPTSLPREAAALLRQADTTTLALGPLGPEDTARLAAQVLGVPDLPAPLVRRIHDRAEGNPLYVIELARALRDRGLIQISGGLATVRLDEAGIDGIVFPEGLDGVIAERIALLDPGLQLSLKSAAVLGRAFDLDGLAAVRPSQTDLPVLAAQLERLSASGLVEPHTSGFRFVHALIEACAYGQLLRDQAADLHRAAAHWSESQGASPAITAQHWSQAGDHDRAQWGLAEAARAAAASGALSEAVEFVGRALTHARQAARPLDRREVGALHYLAGNAQRELGYYRKGAESLQASIALLHRPVPHSTLGKVGASVGALARLRLGRPRPVATAARGDVLTLAAALHSLSEISYEHGDIPLTLSSLLTGLNQAQRAGGDSPELAKLLMGAAFVGLSAPWALDPMATRTRAMEMAARLDEDRLWSWILFIAANFELALGNCAEGMALAGRCVPICIRSGEVKSWYTTVATQGNIRRVEGRLHESQMHDHELLGIATDRGLLLAEVWARTALVKSHALLNQFDALDEELARLTAIFAVPANVTEGSTDNYMTLHLGYALSHTAANRKDAALASLQETARLLDTMKSPGIYGMEPASLMSGMVRLWAGRGADPVLLARVLKVVLAYAGRLKASYPGARAKALLVKGDLSALQGGTARAQSFWEQARAEATARGLLQDEAEAGRRLGGAHLDRAGAILASLNLPWPVLWDAPA